MNADILKPSREQLAKPVAALLLGTVALSGCNKASPETKFYTVPHGTSLSEIVQENCPEADRQDNVDGQFAIMQASERANNDVSTGDVLNIPVNLCDDIRDEL